MKCIYQIIAVCAVVLLPLQILGQAATKAPVPSLNDKRATEYSPSISADGRTMIFQSDREIEWKLFESQKQDDGTWSEPVPLEAINEECDFLAGPNISYDGNTLYYTAFIEGKTESEDIYYSTLEADGEWSAPINLGEPINTDSTYEGFSSISSDGNALYFVRFNPDTTISGVDCFSIYVSQKGADGQWQTPEVLPSPINEGCESAPVILADNKTLIFSSVREGGQGMLDIYQSTNISEGVWSRPVSLDFVNTEDNDQSPTIDASGELMYFYTNEDIYSVTVPEEFRQSKNITLSGTVTDLITNDPLAAKIEVLDASTMEETASLENNANNGQYTLVLNSGFNYLVRFIHPDYDTAQLTYNLKELAAYSEINEDIALKKSSELGLSVKNAEDGKMLSLEVAMLDPSKEDSVFITTNDSAATNVNLVQGRTYNFFVHNKSYEEYEASITPEEGQIEEAFLLQPRAFDVVFNVNDVRSNRRVRGKVVLKNKTTGESITINENQAVSLKAGERYEILVTSDKGYTTVAKTIHLDDEETLTALYKESVSRTYQKPDSAEKEDRLDQPELAMASQPRSSGSMVMDLEAETVAEIDLSPRTIHFDTGIDSLNIKAKSVLEELVEVLVYNEGITLKVIGHTDNVGSSGANQQLARARAKATVDFLASMQVDTAKIQLKALGETQPVASNDTEAGRKQNRRVELQLVEE